MPGEGVAKELGNVAWVGNSLGCCALVAFLCAVVFHKQVTLS